MSGETVAPNIAEEKFKLKLAIGSGWVMFVLLLMVAAWSFGDAISAHPETMLETVKNWAMPGIVVFVMVLNVWRTITFNREYQKMLS